MITHFLPMRELIAVATDHTGNLNAGATRRWGLWMVQGYAWMVGGLFWNTAGVGNSALNIYQGFEDRTVVPPANPPYGRWFLTNTIVVLPAINTYVPFKVNILYENAYIELVSGSNAVGAYQFAAYLRND